MKKIILLIDPNKAIQTMTGLALGKVGYDIHALSEIDNAEDTINKIRPNIIICSRTIEGLDPLQLCIFSKEKLKSKLLGFILLVPSDTSEAEFRLAKSAGVDYVLTKPFKSSQLKELVENLSETDSKKEYGQFKPVVLVSKNILSEKILERFLKYYSVPVIKINSGYDAITALGGNVASATVIFTEKEEKLEWYNPLVMGKLVTIQQENNQASSISSDINLHRPLSNESLEELLQNIFPGFEFSNKSNKLTELTEPQKISLAKKVSLKTYETLINSSEFQKRQWKKSSVEVQKNIFNILNSIEGDTEGH